MKPYKDIGNDSGVLAYEYGEDWIRVKFTHGGIYEYRLSKIGEAHLHKMKQKADLGDGLNGYINSNPKVRNGWSQKFP